MVNTIGHMPYDSQKASMHEHLGTNSKLVDNGSMSQMRFWARAFENDFPGISLAEARYVVSGEWFILWQVHHHISTASKPDIVADKRNIYIGT